jgi:phospholipid/cholesterol/gamma-HCH transport system substrate-binding protein
LKIPKKITSDLDELTGDPAFRQNLLRLVNGLSGLVSSTKQVQQQVQVATTLDSLKTAASTPNFVVSPSSQKLLKQLRNYGEQRNGED